MPKVNTPAPTIPLESAGQALSLMIQDVIDQVKLNAVELIRSQSLILFTDITMLTPVDTGNARSSWMIAGNDGTVGHGNENGTTSVQVGKRAPQSTTQFRLWNEVDYIVKLEYGWSRQAPQGMVRLSIEQTMQRIREYMRRKGLVKPTKSSDMGRIMNASV